MKERPGGSGGGKKPTAAQDRRFLIVAARAASLGEGAEGVRAILREAFRRPGLSVREAAIAALIALPAVAAVCGELRKGGLLAAKGQGLRLTEAGEAYAAEVLGLAPDVLSGEALAEAALKAFAPWCARRPDPDLALDQSKALPESVVARTLYVHEDDGLAGRAICFVGDDDLNSLAAALCHRAATGGRWTIRRLAVIDKDPRILALITEAAGALHVPIEAHEADLAKGIPPALARQFDVVLTDPPYTVPGAAVFLSRAAELTEAGPGHRCYLSFGHKAPAEALQLVRAVCDCGYAPVAIVPRFNRYEGAAIIGSVSQLLSLRTTPDTRPWITGCYEGPLYTAEV